QRSLGRLLTDLAAEEVADPLALPQAGDHLVEAALQEPELAPIPDTDLDLEIALADPFEATPDGADRIHGQVSGKRRDQGPEDKRDRTKRDHRDRERGLVDLDTRKPDDADRDQSGDRRPGSKRPGQEPTRGKARSEAPALTAGG